LKPYLFIAVLLASLAARAEDIRVEAVRVDTTESQIESAPAGASVDAAAAAPPAADKGLTLGEPYAPKQSDFKVQVGGMIGLVSLPRPLDAEIFVRFADFISVGFSYSDFPAFVAQPLLTAAGATSGGLAARLDQFSAVEIDVRVFPFQGAFFIGSSFGRQSLKGVVTAQTGAGPQQAVADLSTVYATPRVGWMWTMGPGFVLGFDLGVQCKLTGDRSVTLPPGANAQMQSDANSIADVFESPLPSLHLRIGWAL
jgi:hypothetical protein